jgi:hypothetical protein
MLKIVSAVLMAVLVAACASPLSGNYAEGGKDGRTILVDKRTWDWYQEYVTKITGVNKGVFIVGLLDGKTVNASYSYCPGTKCIVRNSTDKLMKQCVAEATGLNLGTRYECVLFARSADILVNYKVVDE